MDSSRLSAQHPQLAARLEALSAQQRQRVVRHVAREVALVNGLREPSVDNALRQGASPDAEATAALRALVERLDEQQWDLQDAVDEGRATVTDQLAAFRRARAANCVMFAYRREDPLAPFEALYEACAALDEDEQRLRELIDGAIRDA